MRSLTKSLWRYAIVLAFIPSFAACDLCFFDPNSAACKGTPTVSSGGAAPSRYLQLDPDTVWLVRQGMSVHTRISVVTTATDANTYVLTMSRLPAGLFASFGSTSVNRTGSAQVQLGMFSTYQGTDRIDFFGDAPNRQIRGALIVTTVKPFTLGYTGPAVSIEAGTSGIVPFTINRAANFTGDVLLGSGGGAPGMGGSMAPSLPTSGSSGTLTVTVPASVAPGTYHVVVSGVYKSFFDTLAIPVTVTPAPPTPDFSLSLANTSFRIVRSGGASPVLSITRNAPQVGAIQMTAENVPNGLLVVFSSNPVTAAVVGVGITALTGSTPGLYTFALAGTWNNITRRVVVSVEVIDPDFSMSLSAPTLNAIIGGGASSTLNFTRPDPQVDGIRLTTQNVPPGVVVTFSANPARGAVSGVGITATHLSVAGSYLFQIVGEALNAAGTALGVTRSVMVSLTIQAPAVADFQIVPPAGPNIVRQGGPTTQFSINIARHASFNNVPIALTANGIATHEGLMTISPNPATGHSSISIYVNPTVSTGTRNITITGTAN
ncbi:MAG: hypothetical protein AB1762_19335, partial [Gemmatimonadota bacterium]